MGLTKMGIAGVGMLCTSLLICFITSIISLNCLADKKNQCAQISGFIALITCCMVIFAGVFGIFMENKLTD